MSKRGHLEQKVIRLYRKKYTQKEIAKTVGITEKTARVWLKDFKNKASEITLNINALDKRLKVMLKDPKTPSIDIRNITESITALENRLNRL